MLASKYKTDKGVAGIGILLSVITLLFIIGILIFIFALMGGELKEATYDSITETGKLANASSLLVVSTTNTSLNSTVAGLTNSVCSLTYVRNGTAEEIASGNYSFDANACEIRASLTSGGYNNTKWNITYGYTYDASNTATDTMDDTVDAVGSTTDWFTIFIVITAMVVLILLTVIIIQSIRGSGLMTGTGEGSGTA